MKICHKCKTEWKGVTQPGTKEICEKCGSDLHSCKNCINFNLNKPHQCMETDIDNVKDKDRFNFCEYFQFKDNNSEKSENNDSDNAKQLFNKLFKK